jgi:hypothetical protein
MLAFLAMGRCLPGPFVLWKWGAKLRAMGKPQ